MIRVRLWLPFTVLLCGAVHAQESQVSPKGSQLSRSAKGINVLQSPVTLGLPGSGPIQVREIVEWLNTPSIYEEFSVELPNGLKAGQDAVVVPANNPLNRAKVELGRQLFFDRRLSKNNEVSCADCHHPDFGYGRDTQFGVGVGQQTGNRNSPVAFNRLLSGAQFWDGRASSLEEQAKGPIANPIEMASSHEAVVNMLRQNTIYNAQFERIFGRTPNIEDVAKSIASFERVLVTGMSPYDANEPLRRLEETFSDEITDLEAFRKEQPEQYAKYVEAKALAEKYPMSESAKRGRVLFFTARANCAACHVGANFTDEKYHNLGVGMMAEKPDFGRFEVTKNEADKGAFKTPTVRNVAMTAPYMHDGSQKTLEEVVEWYSKGGHPNPYLSDKIRKIDLNDEEKKDLVAFMKSLTGELPKVEQGRLPR